MKILFVSGIDTGIGKTVATAVLAKKLAQDGKSVITQKLIQTGCKGISEDILEHRRIMGIAPLPEDEDFTTCPYVLDYPASPHLACEMQGVEIDFSKIDDSTRRLAQKYSTVIIEGAGGLMVPLTRDYLTADFVTNRKYPLVLVVSSRLGSLNHALLNFEVCAARNIVVAGVVYNTYPQAPKPIEDSTREYLKQYLGLHCPNAFFMEIGKQNF